MKLRIHHFFDIIRDFGSGKEILPHPHGHRYHILAEQIRNKAGLEFELVVGSDEICRGCTHLIEGVCDDIITHRNDFKGKEDFNNHLDKRIMEVCNLRISQKYTLKELYFKGSDYIKNIEFIYEGNDAEHTLERKINVIKGLEYYAVKHELDHIL